MMLFVGLSKAFISADSFDWETYSDKQSHGTDHQLQDVALLRFEGSTVCAHAQCHGMANIIEPAECVGGDSHS